MDLVAIGMDENRVLQIENDILADLSLKQRRPPVSRSLLIDGAYSRLREVDSHDAEQFSNWGKTTLH